jgi:Spondin_N
MAIALGAAAMGQPDELTIKVENLQASGGFSFTPFWFGSHDGSFDLFNAGGSAAMFPGVSPLAELGDTSALMTHFGSVQPGGSQLTFVEPNGAPVFSPGESGSINLAVNDASTQRFLSYMSMVVPSNDLFVGSDMAIELFDAVGNFNGPVTIDIFGESVYDNGSEVNNVLNGGAFVMGVNGMLGDDENGVITAFFSDPGAGAYIGSILGQTTAAGMPMTMGFDRATHIGRITITPAPSTFAVLALLSPVALRRRRR